MFINTAFYCHDKAVFTYAAEDACLAASMEPTGQQALKKAIEIFDEKSNEELIGRWDMKVSADVTDDSVKLYVHAESGIFKDIDIVCRKVLFRTMEL